ncbi:kinase domain containing protein [Fusarium agapanthi]|uniref:Kinase domain containing protein n=1 Tax=Fusarium agapanthi TaxID=1803897 RepID=A0A9P5E8Q5_9HYPO|nr:kinase domain containing protein [Fusarium agapanthi]
MEVQGDIDFERNAKLDPGPTESTSIYTASPTRKKIFAILVLMGKAPTISDICDEGLSDDDLPFHLDPNGLKLVRRDGTSSQPIQAFINWKEHESDMFDSYQWYMLVPYFVLADDDDARVTHYTMSYMVPLPFSVTESVQNCASSPGAPKCVLKIADSGSMQYHDDQAYHQRGSEICTDSAYGAPELLTGGLAPISDLWAFGCIILHFIVWYQGGWALVNSLSATSSAEEEEEEGSDDDKFFKSGNLNITRPRLDSQGLTEGAAGGAVIGQDKDDPNTVVLEESIKQPVYSRYHWPS